MYIEWFKMNSKFSLEDLAKVTGPVSDWYVFPPHWKRIHDDERVMNELAKMLDISVIPADIPFRLNLQIQLHKQGYHL